MFMIHWCRLIVTWHAGKQIKYLLFLVSVFEFLIFYKKRLLSFYIFIINYWSVKHLSFWASILFWQFYSKNDFFKILHFYDLINYSFYSLTTIFI